MSEERHKEEKRTIKELRDVLRQKDADKQQLQASYDEALQALADSEAKRETAERELKIAQDQMATMWKELESLHQRLDGTHPPSSSSPLSTSAPSYSTASSSPKISLKVPSVSSCSVASSPPVPPPPAASTSPTPPTEETDGPIELCCTLCNEKIRSGTAPSVPVSATPTPSNSPAHSPPKTKSSYRLWPFGGGNSHHKTRINELNDHSRVCSSKLKSSSPSPQTRSPKPQRKLQSRGSSPQVQSEKRSSSSLIVNVTRTPTAATDLAPFKVVTWTNMTSQFSAENYEVYRSAGDFQWLHDVLQDNCPERVVAPLRTTISLDATVSEYQRFLSRLVAHKTLRIEQPFIVFLTGTIEELRVLRAKFRPHLPSEESLQYRPTQGRDTSSGALVATKDYLHSLENNLLGLVHHLQQRTSNDTQREDTMSHWFRHIAEGEPCDTYLKLSSGDLARTCEMIESQRSTFDGDDALCVQNLQSIADYIHSAVDLLARVEQAVDRFLYWDEEVMLYEAVTSSPSNCDMPVTGGVTEEVFDDSGVSSISGSSTGGGGGGNNSSCHSRDESTGPDTSNTHHGGNCWSPSRRNIGLDDSISEKWAQASSNCSDAKEYLEMICRDLSDELAQFDLRKEQELRQVFLDLAAGQMEKNEKLQGKWYAMKCLLDTPIKPSLRAIQFVSNNNGGDTNSEATVSEYQRFLSRLVAHKTLRIEQPFIVFLTGTIEELRVLRAKFRPHLPSEESLQYRPTQGRDTSSGALVATKDYLHSLENNLLGLVHHLQQRTSNDTQREDTMSHWFRHIAEGEPCDTYLKLSSGDLARTCEMIESQWSTFDGDDALCVQNLQSIADYIHSAVDLLARVEQAVDRFLYWDEEVMLYEAVTSSPSNCDMPVTGGVTEEVFDDSGVSSISGSSTGGGGGGNNSSCHSRDESTGPDASNTHHGGNCWSPSRRNIGLDDSISEKWAQASSNCSDAKEYLEMICRDLSDELAQFDLRKEQELRQVFLDLAAGQMEKNEKLQGKWYAMKCLLDTPIKPSLRAIQFVSNNNGGDTNSEDHSSTRK